MEDVSGYLEWNKGLVADDAGKGASLHPQAEGSNERTIT